MPVKHASFKVKCNCSGSCQCSPGVPSTAGSQPTVPWKDEVQGQPICLVNGHGEGAKRVAQQQNQDMTEPGRSGTRVILSQGPG